MLLPAKPVVIYDPVVHVSSPYQLPFDKTTHNENDFMLYCISRAICWI